MGTKIRVKKENVPVEIPTQKPPINSPILSLFVIVVVIIVALAFLTFSLNSSTPDGGQENIIPDDNQDTGTTPISSAEILSSSNYYDSINYNHIVGEIQNTGNVNLEYVKIVVTFYDASNIVVGTTFTYTEHDILIPQQKSPFKTNIASSDFTGTPTNYTLQLTYSATNNNPYNGLEILSNSDSTDSIGWNHIVGEVKNTGSQTANYVKLIVTYYDSGGDVVGTTFTFTDPLTLTSDQTAPFETNMDLDDTAGSISSYLIQVEA